MTLNVKGDDNKKNRDEVNIYESRPLIVFEKSTVKHFIGAKINLKILESVIVVNTHAIDSPVFVIRCSTAEIFNCTFLGIKNSEKKNPKENDIDTAVIFDVQERSRITIQECLFENIQVDMSYDVSAAVYAENSQMEIYHSNLSFNTAQWGVIMGVASNLTVNESVFSSNIGDQGASFNVQQNSNLKVGNSTFTDNKAGDGGALAVTYTSAVEIAFCVFSGNSVDWDGAALNVQNNGSVIITNSTFRNNIAGRDAGALEVSRTSAAKITSCVFSGNSADTSAGALLVGYTSTAEITSCVFSGNSADQGGTLNVQQDGSSVSINDSKFTANYATFGGVILAMMNVILRIETSNFVANNASSVGAVLGCYDNVNATMFASTFGQNIASRQGGVVYADRNSHVMVNHCNFIHNDAPRGSDVFLSNSYISISGTYFSYHYTNLIYIKSSEFFLNACEFSNNSLNDGSLIQAEDQKTNIVIENSNFMHNKMNGVIRASNTQIHKCKFAYNIIFGLGIINAFNVQLIDSTMLYNTIHKNPGIRYGNATIKSCTFTRNTVDTGYGLVMNYAQPDSDSTLKVIQSNFMQNQGDVILIDSSRLDIVLDTCNFTGNIVEHGTLYICDNAATLRTSNTTIITPADSNKVAAYFKDDTKRIRMTDYMTYKTCFISGNTTLNSSSTENFLQEAEHAGLVFIDSPYPYRVTQEETVFASG